MDKFDFSSDGGFPAQLLDFGELLGRGISSDGNWGKEEKFVSTPSGDVYYFITPSLHDNARWLVLTHGLGMDHTVFDAIVDEFSPYYNIITWDLPLHGMSEVYAGFSFESCALALKSILDSEGVKTAFIGGHCIGGCAVQAFADMFPETCLGLVLIDTFPFGPELYEKSSLRWLEKTVGPLRAMPSGFIAAAMAGLFSCTFDGEHALRQVLKKQNTACIMDVLAAALSELPCRSMPNYSFPVLDIVGQNDRLGPIKELNEIAARKYGYMLAPIAHAGHTPYLDNPMEFCWALEGFLQ